MMWRLPEAEQSQDVGKLINFEKSISFRLNGKKLTGLEGDTVFSAAVCSGYNSAGVWDDQPVAIDVELAPFVWVKNGSGHILASSAAFQIVEGGEYFIFDPATPKGPKNSILDRLARMIPVGKPLRTFGTDFSKGNEHWLPPTGHYRMQNQLADVAVVGGGVAGLKAAIASAKNGKSVLLCERSGSLGGLATLFGSQVDGQRASERVPILIEQLKSFPKVTIWLNCFVSQANVGRLEALWCGSNAEKPLIHAKISAAKIILATGQKNIPPPFQGNRTVGTISVTSAYILARDFGVFPGKNFASFSAENVAYNLLLILAKAGAVASKAIDYRLSVSSRFIEFLKAYGVTNMSALSPSKSKIHNDGLSLEFKSTQSVELAPRQIDLDCLIVSNDWQPDLELWIDCGGSVAWDANLKKLMALETIAGVELVGDAGNELIEANIESDQFETPPEQVMVASNSDSDSPIFLNLGRNFSTISPLENKSAGVVLSSLIGGQDAAGDVGVHSNALDFAVLVSLDRLPAEAVSELIEEKCFSAQKSGREFANFVRPESARHMEVLVEHNFGPNAVARLVSSAEGGLVRGAMLFETGGPPDARVAIGSIVEDGAEGWTAILSQDAQQFKSCAAMVSGRRITCTLTQVPKNSKPSTRP